MAPASSPRPPASAAAMWRRAVLVLAAAAVGLPACALGGQLWADVCTQADVKGLPFCDRSRPRAERVADYVKRVPLAAKAQMMVNGAQPLPDLHIPPYQWGSEGLHGPLEPCVCDPTNTTCKCPTSFPCPSALGTAFNVTLYWLIGQADGREGRAINNLRNHVTQNQYGDGIDYWSPTINMQRDPRWGRNQEVPGEDPMLTGAYATHFVQGLQGSRGGLDPSHPQIPACCKHFVANSLENWEGHTRHNFDANVSKADLALYYLPPFRACVQEGRSLGVMCSYNAVNGEPSCANSWLLKTTLRESWRFDGYVTSDCNAIRDEFTPEPNGHGWSPDAAHAAASSIKAGTDVNCGQVYKTSLPPAVAAKLLDEADVDKSFSRLTDIQMRLGLFDNNKAEQPYFNLGIDDIDTPAHQLLALEAAQQSIVLLKNDAGILPLRHGNLAVIGPHFNDSEVFLSNYHGSRCANGKPGGGKDFSCVRTAFEALQASNKPHQTVGVQGCQVDSSQDEIAEAVAAAKSSDSVVLVMGIDNSQEREGMDRVNTTLPGLQQQLAEAVLAAGRPTVLVLVNGGAMSLGPLKDKFHAILSCVYGGEQGAVAMAQVLFGLYNPSGKLAATMYPPEYVSQIPLTDLSLTTPPGRTHMFYTGPAEFVFGTGLSYTDWGLELASAPPPTFSTDLPAASQAAELVVQVRNLGDREGRHTVLLLWRPVGHHQALRQKLAGFDGLASVAPGAEGLLRFPVHPELLALPDAQGRMVLHPGAYEWVVRDGTNELVLPLTVTGPARVVDASLAQPAQA